MKHVDTVEFNDFLYWNQESVLISFGHQEDICVYLSSEMFNSIFIEQLWKLASLSEALQARPSGLNPKLFCFDRVLCYQTRGDLQARARRGAMDIGGRIPKPELPR